MTEQAQKESQAQTETDAELKLKPEPQPQPRPPPESERNGPACAVASKCEKSGRRAFRLNAGRGNQEGRGGGGGGKSGLRRPKRGISTLSGAVSRYGGVRALALGLSFGGRGVRRRCCKMRVVAIKRGESRAWGRFFFGSEAERPRCGPPCGSSGPAHFAKPSPKRRARLWPDRRGRLPSFAPPLNLGCRQKQ